jgi:serine protease inhibitor
MKRMANNNRLKMRETTENQFQSFGKKNHNKNLERLFLERDFTLGQKNREFDDTNSMGSNGYDNLTDVGEITGGDYEKDIDNRGLPMRSQYNIRKKIYDDNEHLDFNIFDDRPSKLKVKSFDPTVGNSTSGFADIKSSMKNISSQLNPLSICSSNINKLNNDLFYTLYDMMKKNYLISGIGLTELFSSLYLSSAGMTDNELKKFFDFPDKEVLYKGLSNIYLNLTDVQHMINIKNFMIIGNDVPYDPEYTKIIKYFCYTLVANIEDSDESKKINMIINKIMKCEMRNIITPENLFDLQLMFLSVATIHPIWKYPFDQIATDFFFRKNNKIKINYLHAINRSYGYFEDNEHQLLEILCENNLLSMGILLNKGNEISDIDDTTIQFFITHMKDCIIDEVLIPTFTQDTKIRFTNTFKQMGLQTVFIKLISPKLFPEGGVLQDIIQNIKITIDNSHSGAKHQNTKQYKTSRKFIANKEFIYYFRLLKTNTILLMGVYK